MKPAARVPLSSRAYIDLMDRGLRGVSGAQHIISQISSRRSVTKLILGHNKLGDEGCIVLFKFLCSAIGRKYQVAEISLNTNHIGNRGLLAIAEYLQGNQHLKQLFLQNNEFTDEIAAKFASALNSSRLELLSLTSNRTLSNSFLHEFLPLLDAPELHELHLSAIGLTAEAAPPIVEYLSSPRCRLHALNCNGNSLGYRGVRSIVRAVERHNFTILTLEMYSNHAESAPTSSDNTEDDEDEERIDGVASSAAGLDAWKANEAHIRRLLLRNSHLKRVTEKDALSLLRYSRPLLLTHSTASATTPATRCDNCSCGSSSLKSAPVDPDPLQSTNTGFAFRSLPTELQLYIMSFLAPSLSPAQRVRIYTYAASPATLPRTTLCLSGFPIKGTSMCVLDPAMMPFGSSGSGGCSGGRCAGSGGKSVVCHKEQQRTEWLKTVGCDTYDPHREDGIFGVEGL
ncbi:hypothetical protein HMN09_00582800 [Mycena chlorophos]|uniref:RNI-like protein n=1 Tax=Mycena chlorophos TaxID=658473 RepID=A0A8H6T2D7_MYCCL|nr:hypothetical protein HMN09_00582800 [Mycena chlorophos]